MADGTKAIAEANIKSKTEPLLPPEVERDDMSSTTWRLNVLDFPALPPRKDGDHSSFNLRRLLRTPSKPSSQIFMYVCMYVCMYDIIDVKCNKVFGFLVFVASF